MLFFRYRCFAFALLAVAGLLPNWAYAQSKPGDKVVSVEVIETADINIDKKDDVWVYFVETTDPANRNQTTKKLVKKEADLNFDGKKDVVRLYDTKEQLSEETADLDFDGKKDIHIVWKNGVVQVKDFYHSHKELVFIRKIYVEGKLGELRRDEDMDGVFDYCELWQEGLRVRQVGRDLTGDGECDTWEAR